ncbi:MAG: HDOD domain-containing protein [Phycisphaeraceae bacterium]|nr:HDOD domain-containing protein [Phycisphaeraceae bacterium]
MTEQPGTLSALFVDDEQNILDGLRRMLRPMAGEWRCQFVTCGARALEIMAEQPVDVIVSDMRMPGMDGAALLGRVRVMYPDTVRFVLSGHAERDDILKAVGPIHQFMQKPCESAALRAALARVTRMRRVLSLPELRGVVSCVESLPALPESQRRLMLELEHPECNATTVGRIIASDVAMTAKILQLVNSAFFGAARTISTPVEAVTRLGVNTIRSLVMSMRVFDAVAGGEATGLGGLWKRSLDVSARARATAERLGIESDGVNNAALAGMLHEVGRLAVASRNPELLKRAIDTSRQRVVGMVEAEHGVYGATQGEIGGYMLALWGFADEVVDAVSFQAMPGRSGVSTRGALTAVHMAVSACEMGAMWRVNADEAYLRGVGVEGEALAA